jgi:3-hydroxybutyryl-CoA dehydrogenase
MMPEPITVGVAGLGTMGLGIAQVYAAAGYTVLATDAHEPARANAHTRLRAALEPRVAKGALSPAAMEATLANLHIVETPEALAPAILIIEAILETLAAKQDLFTALEAVTAPQTVLATNTSSLSVTAIASALKHPARVLGLHFFNPAPVMKLVELVAHPGTSAAALTLARTLTETAGKTVIACPDRPGFIVNRCARPFYGEALALIEEGRTPSDIDAAMLAAGYRIGPLSLIDLIGADINLAATEGLHAALHHPRYHVFETLKARVAAGRLGRKSGQGFLYPATPGPAPKDAAQIALRIEATLANEAAWLLSEGGVTAAGIDQALKLGLNFPRGPFDAAALHGPDTIRATLAMLESRAPAHLKTRYLPPPAP